MLKRHRITIPEEKKDWLFSVLSWLDIHFEYFACFQQHGIVYPHGTFPQKIFAGHLSIEWDRIPGFKGKSEIIGVLAYDYKNQIERLSSENSVLVDCLDFAFFIPELRIEWEDDTLLIETENELDFKDLFDRVIFSNPKVDVIAHTDKNKYFEDIQAIRQHIEEGDIYEVNYCMPFSFVESNWNPISGYLDLMAISPMPFSGLFKFEDKFLLSASPERFLKKEGRAMIAQPIKGTIRRGKDAVEDLALSRKLLASEKERAENLMIVDLMRNDLSKISETGSIKVMELFGVYSFAKVHQMISTVGSSLKDGIGFREIIEATFPMGSMTGAPKIKCMALIEQYENFKRGWFSGTFGIIHANGDFDFNVVIRSIIFDRCAGKGYFAVGSAITYDADPAYEWEECYLKAAAILEVLEKRS
jgi:para-aminobenzoate synthetase component 1